MAVYSIGSDYLKKGAVYRTYGIKVDNHENKIEVYKDELLRDQILHMLRKEGPWGGEHPTADTA